MFIKRLEYLLKHNSIAQKLYISIGSSFFRVLGLFIKKRDNLVVLSSLIGKSYGDSPRVLFEAMKRDPRFSSCSYVWAFDDVTKYKVDGAEVVSLNSLTYFIRLLQSTIWINNVAAARNLRIKPHYTTYLNTMHGVSVLKKDGNAQKNRNDYDRSDVDFQCTCCKEDDIVFCRDFKVKPNAIVRCGMPRNDYLYCITDEDCLNAKRRFQLPLDKRVILYAPTWRDNEKYEFEMPLDLAYWREKLGEKFVLLIRAHHLVMDTLSVQFDDFVRDGTVVKDASDLLPAIDIVITDYSSIAIDFSILERPIYSYAYDYIDYQSNRGSYLDINDVFEGNVFYTQHDIVTHIMEDHWDEDTKKSIRIKNRFMPSQGIATLTCLNFLAEHVI